MELRKAYFNELNEVLTLYKSMIGKEGCAWTEQYPDEIEINNDYNSGCLYVLINNDIIIGAVSIVPENELDDFRCWKINDGTHKEIARVVIAEIFQGNGYARNMLTMLFNKLLLQSCRSIHLMVAKDNPAAIRTYKSLGFDFIDECYLYNHNYYLCEKILDSL